MRVRELLGPSPRNPGALGALVALLFVATALVPTGVRGTAPRWRRSPSGWRGSSPPSSGGSRRPTSRRHRDAPSGRRSTRCSSRPRSPRGGHTARPWYRQRHRRVLKSPDEREANRGVVGVRDRVTSPWSRSAALYRFWTVPVSTISWAVSSCSTRTSLTPTYSISPASLSSASTAGSSHESEIVGAENRR